MLDIELKERQKKEALKRLKVLEVHENVVKDFKEKGKLYVSEKNGMLFWLKDEPLSMVKKFEEESGNLVYHVIHNYTEFGELYTLLYISKDEDEWELDLVNIDDGICCAYVQNMDIDFYSEYGYIVFKKMFGGLVRIS